MELTQLKQQLSKLSDEGLVDLLRTIRNKRLHVTFQQKQQLALPASSRPLNIDEFISKIPESMLDDIISILEGEKQ